MTQEVFVDTGAWVALSRPDDGDHGIASGIWDNLTREGIPLLTTDFVLDETVTFLQARMGHAVSVRAGRAILESAVARLVFLDEAAIRDAWTWYQRFSDKSYSFTDVTSFRVMESLGVQRAFTFDHHFAQAGFHILD